MAWRRFGVDAVDGELKLTLRLVTETGIGCVFTGTIGAGLSRRAACASIHLHLLQAEMEVLKRRAGAVGAEDRPTALRL